MTATIACPHCQKQNQAGALFCERCGKAVPPAKPTLPRLVTVDSPPKTAVGTHLFGEQLVKQTRRAANTLIAVGCLQLAGAIVVVLLLVNVKDEELREQLPRLLAVQGGLAFVFTALGIWARRNPLPATITGVALYGTLLLTNIILNLARGGIFDGGSHFSLGIGCLDILLMLLLIRGVRAALEYRKLVERFGLG